MHELQMVFHQLNRSPQTLRSFWDTYMAYNILILVSIMKARGTKGLKHILSIARPMSGSICFTTLFRIGDKGYESYRNDADGFVSWELVSVWQILQMTTVLVNWREFWSWRIRWSLIWGTRLLVLLRCTGLAKQVGEVVRSAEVRIVEEIKPVTYQGWEETAEGYVSLLSNT